MGKQEPNKIKKSKKNQDTPLNKKKIIDFIL